ncbi:hypothetical protein [Rhodococcus qingshengii]|uniref:hypothetical protein n=1 Tax=Rhodococcus qingshengii TaxID=334542 RepID=UPI001C8C4FBD|nr:hypothetical protein [Rhodococcus qingshengii]MBX9147976.1 hypothetical protein [Rhodococcus qingshengii]
MNESLNTAAATLSPVECTAPDRTDPAESPTDAIGEARTNPEQPSGNSEAARYRRQLRDTEAERNSLTVRIEAMQRTEILRLAGDELASPFDIFEIGRALLPDLIDDAGDVDPAKVAEAVSGLVGSRPGLSIHARLPKPNAYPNFGQFQGLGSL